jgi:2-methylcitrate dehydratase PrpD
MTGLFRRTLLRLAGYSAGLAAFPFSLSSRLATASPADVADAHRCESDSTPPGAPTMGEQIANFIVNARYEDVPAKVVQKAKEQIVFFFGRAFEGWRGEKADQLRQLLPALQSGGVATTVIGSRYRLLPTDAAFANCGLMRGSTRDDVVWPAGIHAGVITLPTAFAAGELRQATGKQLIMSVILGYEVLGKLGSAAYGWGAPLPRRPTIIYGAFGPVAVAGYLLGLDSCRMANAVGYAANLGIGVAERGMVQHYYGLINRNAMLAVQLAEAGGAAYSRSTIEAKEGLYHSFFGELPDTVQPAINALGSDWEMLKAEQKRYPGTGQSAVAIEMLMLMAQEQGLSADDVTRIDVFMTPERAPRAHEFLAQGPFTRPVEAYSSLPYALALTLLLGEPPVERYHDSTPLAVLNDPAVAREMKKVSGHFEAGHESDRYYRIEVYTRDGRKLVRAATGPSFAFPESAWGDWLRRDGEGVLKTSQLKELEDMLVGLEDIADVTRLMRATVPTAVDMG